jgi:uncharacterized protein YggU (UPF0235/DUF167 family)
VTALALRAAAGGAQFPIRVIPRSSRPQVGGLREGRLLVRVCAAPVDQAANDAVRRILADALDLPARALQITAGQSSRNKTIRAVGIPVAELAHRLRSRFSVLI